MWCRRSVLASFCCIAASSSTQECQSDGQGSCQSNQGNMMASLIAEDAIGRVQDEQNNLLQRHVDGKETSMIAPTSSGDLKKAVTFEGGGFLSLADFAGVTSGLMAAVPSKGFGFGKQEKHLEKLFEKFGILSGISGGTWFMTQLIYSRKFQKLVERSAAFPHLAEATWAVEYYAAVLNPIGHVKLGAQALGLAECIWKMKNVFLQANASESQALLQVNQEMLPMSPQYLPWYLEVLAEMSILIQTGAVSWIDLVGDALYFRGSGISPTKGLGTKTANAWAKGKLEIIGTTIITPPGDAAYSGSTGNLTEVGLFAKQNGKQNFAYKTAFPKGSVGHDPIIVPARFSAIVGDGEHQKAPVSFCATPDCYGLTSTYTGTVRGQKEFEQTINLQDVYTNAFEKSGGKVSIAGASSASSAFKGFGAVESGLPEKQGCVSLAVWSTDKANGKSFQEGYDMRNSIFKWDSISNREAGKIASAGLQPLVDGGPTDYTGLGHAVALNATDIVSMLDTGTGSMEIASLLTQFEGGGNPERVIFQEPNAAGMRAAYDSFTKIKGVEGSEFLDEIRFGTVPCTTKANKWFGVAGGRNVNVNFIAIVTKNITIGLIEEPYSYNSFFDFAKLTGEIVRTMTQKDNQDKVGEMLDYFL